MKRGDVVRYLLEQGCEFVRLAHTHDVSIWNLDVYVNPVNNKEAIVGRHNEVPNRYVMGMCKRLGIPHPWER